MMFLDLVSELEKKHDIFAKHCYDNRQVYSLENISDLDQEQQPKSDVVYYAYDLSTLHNRKLPRNLIGKIKQMIVDTMTKERPVSAFFTML